MKKFLLSLSLIAAVSTAFVFTSCKDDDEPTAEVSIDTSFALNTLQNQLKGSGKTVTKNGEVITVVDAAANTTTTYSYTYTVNGETYTSATALQDALAGMSGTIPVVVNLVATSNGQQTVIGTTTSNIFIGEDAATILIDVPTAVPSETSAIIIYLNGGTTKHSGGGVN